MPGLLCELGGALTGQTSGVSEVASKCHCLQVALDMTASSMSRPSRSKGSSLLAGGDELMAFFLGCGFDCARFRFLDVDGSSDSSETTKSAISSVGMLGGG